MLAQWADKVVRQHLAFVDVTADLADPALLAFGLQDRGAVGRTPVLIPMAWENNLPVIGNDGKAPKEAVNLTTRPGYEYAPLAESDAFNTPALKAMWEWNHVPDDSLWRTGNGFLSLTAGRIDRELTDSRNTLTVRCTYPVTEVTVQLDGSNLAPGGRAGLCALQYQWSAAALRRTEEGYLLSLLKKPANDQPGEIIAAEVPASETVTLKAVFDFTDMRDTVSFYYLENGAWQPLGTPQKVTFDLNHFAGVRAGLFHYNTETVSGEAKFSSFDYRVTAK